MRTFYCIYCCCLAPDRKVSSFIYSIIVLLIFYNVLCFYIFGGLEVTIDSVFIDLAMLYFIGYKHKLVYSNTFKGWYFIFGFYIIVESFIFFILLFTKALTYYSEKEELLRFDNINIPQEKFQEFRHFDYDDIDSYLKNNYSDMNEVDYNYFNSFIEKIIQCESFKKSIWTYSFYLSSRTIIVAILVHLFNSTIDFYKDPEETGEESDGEFVANNLEDENRILEDGLAKFTNRNSFK